MLDKPRPGTPEYYAAKRETDRRDCDYRVGSVEFHRMHQWPVAVVVLWLKTETADEIARRFVDEAYRRGWRRPLTQSWRNRCVLYLPPLANVVAVTDKHPN